MSKNKKSDVRGGRASNTNSNRRRLQPDTHTQSPAQLPPLDKGREDVPQERRVGMLGCPSLQRLVPSASDTPPTKMHTKTHPTPRTSSSWTLIRPKLYEIEKLIGEEFVPVRDVPTKHLGISYQTFLTLRGKHPELEEAVQRGKARRNELVLKGMYDLATGRAVRVEDEKAPDEKGNLRITKRRIIRFEPQADIGTTLMKQYAGWSDNPKTDNAVANALNNKDWTATINLIPGFSDLSPKSSEADNFKAHPKEIGNHADAPAVQGENYNGDSLADQKNAEKEDNDDDSGE